MTTYDDEELTMALRGQQNAAPVKAVMAELDMSLELAVLGMSGATATAEDRCAEAGAYRALNALRERLQQRMDGVRLNP
jgi:hypothetical protein